MASTFENLIQSHQFTFFIGKEEKPIVVHAAAVAVTSPQLHALVNGGMEESEKRCARIADVEVNDFIRFCEYAYRGDYTIPQCEELPPEPSSTFNRGHHETEVKDDDEWAFGFSTKSAKKKGKKAQKALMIDAPEVPAETEYHEESQVRHLSRAQLRAQFNSRKHTSNDGPKTLILQHFEPKPNDAVNQNFTPVFLAHARLYCFAHFHMVAPLKELTLDKLHKTLMSFKLFTQRVGDIVELARYAYSNTDLPNRSDDGTIDELRKLIVEYIVCEIDIIGRRDEFVDFMEEGGEFVGDFWGRTRDCLA